MKEKHQCNFAIISKDKKLNFIDLLRPLLSGKCQHFFIKLIFFNLFQLFVNCQSILFYSCSPHWESKEHFYYILWMFALGFFFPLAIIVISSILTIRDLLRVRSNNSKSNISNDLLNSPNKLCDVHTFCQLAFKKY